ncbi:NAD(P)-dependent alcohol dehydrogenase [Deinococcus cellulosilyticus]|uniref:Alcohol dehydrogenase n=1 Tax=Deinococcus cellulosilyticus (strain DSM 18568 / NBRC 106333 / KACC 11606 / 5516J-15) TaxID=1223518 RepID=A0A511N304_DEIC1|nr:NAD(P)-dependent alcohol dehydrogenase [Deinococcus cellulosilyticus]GEM47233.1 alcohol dehydrogenase [Deinococcus cellulosilyticus NBRC 106333 = KACC 11606]
MTTTQNPSISTSARTMKAVVREEYGPPDVLRLTDVPRPEPEDNEVLIKIHATTVTSADCRMRALKTPAGFGLIMRLVSGVNRPRQPVLGVEFAGEIEKVGKNVTRFRAGDRVFGMTGMGMGCHAQYRCLPETGALAHIASNLTHEQAASLPFGGTTALDFFRRGKLKAGDRVLINGASGAVGVAAVQLAHHFGAEVTAVCSGANANLVRSLGAHRVIDYTRADFASTGETYDLIMDTVGTAPFARSKPALRKGGRLLLVLATLAQMLSGPWQGMTSGIKVIAGPTTERQEDVQLLAKLAQEGKLKPVIDRQYSLDQIAAAHHYADTGRKRGSVVVTVSHSS